MKILTEEEKNTLLTSLKEGPKQSFIAFEFGNPKPHIEIADITSIYEDKVLCNFYVGTESKSEFINKNDIIAIFDNKNGDTRFHGWTGKFLVLRPEKLELVENYTYELNNR